MKNKQTGYQFKGIYSGYILLTTLLLYTLVACSQDEHTIRLSPTSTRDTILETDVPVIESNTIENIEDGLTPTPNSLNTPLPPTATSILPTATRLIPTPTPYPIPETGWWMYTNGNEVRDVTIYDNMLWAATGGGVVAWDLETNEAIKYTVFDGLLSNDSTSILVCPIPDPRVIVNTPVGLSIFNLETQIWSNWTPENSPISDEDANDIDCHWDRQQLIIVYGSTQFDLYSAAHNEWLTIDVYDEAGLSYIDSARFNTNEENDIWIVTNKEVALLSESTSIYTEDNGGIPSDDIDAFEIDAQGIPWFAIRDGLVKGVGENWRIYNDENILGFPQRISSIATVPDGTLWVGSYSEICHFDPITETCLSIYRVKDNFNMEVGSKSFTITVSEDTVYLSGHLGISQLVDNSWHIIQLKNYEIGNRISGITEDNNGNVWVASRSTLFQTNQEDREKFEVLIPPIGAISGIFNTTDGLWVGNDAGSEIHFYIYDSKEWETIRLNPGKPGFASVISQDEQGRLWAGHNSAITIWTNVESKSFGPNEGMPRGRIVGLEPLGDVMWAGFRNGIVRFQNDEFIIFDQSNSDIPQDITTIKSYVDGTLLIGSEVGLFILDEGRVSSFTSEFGSVTGMFVSKEGDIWTTTESGNLFHFDGVSWESFPILDGLFTADLLNLYFSNNSIFVDALGTVWIGSRQGVIRFHP